MLPSLLVNSLFIPWDFVLILLFLGVIVPWRGTVRMKRLLAKPHPTSADRLSLYGATILFQWLLAALIAWRCAARAVSPDEMGIEARDPWRIAWTAMALTGLLCASQIIGLRKLASVPEGRRGSLFAITSRIMPRTPKETILYAGLACTAGISEEFIYRGFVFMAFVRMIVNYGPPNWPAVMFSSAWFSLAHIYQGKRGIFTTFIVGWLFALFRLWTGSLIPAILAHAGLDMAIGLYASRISHEV